MSYLMLLLIFLVTPTVLILVCVARRAAHEAELRRTLSVALPVLISLVLLSAVYAAPWDKWMIDRGVFVYSPAKVAAWAYGIPVEDFLLFALQSLFVGLWSLYLLGRFSSSTIPLARVRLITLAVTGVMVAATVISLSGSSHTMYAASILIWFGPLLLVQLIAGAGALLAQWRMWLAAIVPTTLWLWVAEIVAIRHSIWWIDPVHSVTWRPGGLPLEDLVIFLVGNLLVANTIFFVADPAMRARARGWLAILPSPRATRLMRRSANDNEKRRNGT